MERILPFVPREIDTYYEPFVGGGAVFFELAAQHHFKRAVLADSNDELVRCYVALRDDVGGVITVLSRHRYDQELFYQLRAQDPAQLPPAERAARLIYLNRCGFNGLYRVNSSGKFNVPFGRHRDPTICDEDRLRAASVALRGVTVVCKDFADAVSAARPADFVYLDPPYVPLSATAKFTSYASSGFGPPDQERLAAALRELRARSVRALLSNSDCQITRQLYRDLPIKEISVRRAINSDGGARGPVGELLVRSFDY